MIRLRFAPSPTGYLHVGGLRTALFSYLYAKQQGGSFIFRLEDTDQQRLVVGSEENLVETLRWAGIEVDEGPQGRGAVGPYRQSERLPIYHQHAQQLLEKGHAYPCFCSAETLDQMRAQQQQSGTSPRYDGRCRHLTDAEASAQLKAGASHVIRMKIPSVNQSLLLKDLVRGTIVIDTEQLDDQVLIKASGFPTYHLAVVVDDHLMGITHVVRGEEWLPSYPKHHLLYQYFGWDPPHFIHLPLILNPDRSKLSKRQGDVAVEDFRRQGYLPEALINFVALLGWGPSHNQEIFSKKELIEQFSFDRVSKSGAVFDRDKLNWMNQHYLHALSPDELFKRLEPYLANTPFAQKDPVLLKKACVVSQKRMTTLADIQGKLPLFFEEKPLLTDPNIKEFLQTEMAQIVLNAFRQRVTDMEVPLEAESFKVLMKALQQQTGIKGPDLWHPVRYALTLEEQGPDLGMVVEIFGKQKILMMLDQVC